VLLAELDARTRALARAADVYALRLRLAVRQATDALVALL